jgi:hypothetical protein
MLAQTVNEDAESLRLSNLQTVVGSFLNWDHEVLDLLVVDLAHHA